MDFEIKGNLVDVHRRKTYPAKITVKEGRIYEIERIEEELSGYIVPPLIDTNINLESIYLIPSEYAKVALIHGVVGGVVRVPTILEKFGLLGMSWLMENGKESLFKFSWCVHPYVSKGYSKKDVVTLLGYDNVVALGCVNSVEFSKDLIYEMVFAQSLDKRIVGCVRDISDKGLEEFSKKNIGVVFECKNKIELKKAIKKGFYVGLREPSDFVNTHSTKCMFDGSNISIEDLVCEYIDNWVRECLSNGYDLYRVFQVGSVNPVKVFNLDIGLLRESDWADFLVVDTLEDFNILKTYVKGKMVAGNGIYSDEEKVLGIPSNLKTDLVLSISNGEYTTEFELPVMGCLSNSDYMEVVEEYGKYVVAKGLSKKDG